MTPEIGLTLGITAAAVVLFAMDRLRPDAVALLVLLSLAFTGLVTADEAFSGFASQAVITVWAVYIVSGGLFRTGVADYLGRTIIGLSGKSEARLVALIMLACGLLSAFMNNIGATAVLLPAVVGIARQSRIPLSRLLIPLAFSSLLGGNMTLIGTPPNVLAADILTRAGHQTFGFFDYAPTGIVIFAAGVVFLTVFGRRLLPDRESAATGTDLAFDWRRYVCEVRVTAESQLVGRTLTESRLGEEYDATVMGLERDGYVEVPMRASSRIGVGDVLLLQCPLDTLMRARQDLALEIRAESTFAMAERSPQEIIMFEAVLAPGSRLIGRSIIDVRFRERYGFTVLAVAHHGELSSGRMRNRRLEFGDTLLLQGPRGRLFELEDGDFLVLEPVEIEMRRTHKAPLAVGITALVLLLATFTDAGIATAMVTGSLLMVITGCLTMDEAYQAIEWRSVFLIAGMLPLGIAMESTGTARLLAVGLVSWLGAFGPLAVLAGIFVFTSLLTQPMSNAATTVLLVPIAIDIALALGGNPRPFVLVVVIAASTSFLTPVGHQANVLVFAPGGYKFFDFTRVGAPLTLLVMLLTLVLVPWIWPLFP